MEELQPEFASKIEQVKATLKKEQFETVIKWRKDAPLRSSNCKGILPRKGEFGIVTTLREKKLAHSSELYRKQEIYKRSHN